MFSIGDKVVLQCMGRALLKLLKKRKYLEERKVLYYEYAHGEMKVMIPLDNSDQIGLREVIDRQSVKKFFRF